MLITVTTTSQKLTDILTINQKAIVNSNSNISRPNNARAYDMFFMNEDSSNFIRIEKGQHADILLKRGVKVRADDTFAFQDYTNLDDIYLVADTASVEVQLFVSNYS